MESKLAEILKERGIKHSWLAEKLGVDPSQITRWATWGNIPILENRIRISEALKIPIEEIFFENSVNSRKVSSC